MNNPNLVNVDIIIIFKFLNNKEYGLLSTDNIVLLSFKNGLFKSSYNLIADDLEGVGPLQKVSVDYQEDGKSLWILEKEAENPSASVSEVNKFVKDVFGTLENDILIEKESLSTFLGHVFSTISSFLEGKNEQSED